MSPTAKLRKVLKDRLRYAKSKHYDVPETVENIIKNGTLNELETLEKNWRAEVPYFNYYDPETGEAFKLSQSEYAKLEKVQEFILAHDKSLKVLQSGQELAGRNILKAVRNKLGIDIVNITREKALSIRSFGTKWLRDERYEAAQNILSTLDMLVEVEGYEEIGLRLEPVATEIFQDLESVQYASSQDQIDDAKTHLFSLIVGRPLTFAEVEDIETLTDESEIPF